MRAVGSTTWVTPEGYIPDSSTGPEPAMTSHETLCVLNTNEEDANLEIHVFYSDRDPVGPYKVRAPARRTLHLRLNELDDPEPVPRGVDFSTVLMSDRPVVVQHTRLDSRQSANALLSTIAYPVP